jgi:hypothetical protein
VENQGGTQFSIHKVQTELREGGMAWEVLAIGNVRYFAKYVTHCR